MDRGLFFDNTELTPSLVDDSENLYNDDFYLLGKRSISKVQPKSLLKIYQQFVAQYLIRILIVIQKFGHTLRGYSNFFVLLVLICSRQL